MSGVTARLTHPNVAWVSGAVNMPDEDGDAFLYAKCVECGDRLAKKPYCCKDKAVTVGWAAYVIAHAGCQLRKLDPEKQ